PGPAAEIDQTRTVAASLDDGVAIGEADDAKIAPAHQDRDEDHRQAQRADLAVIGDAHFGRHADIDEGAEGQDLAAEANDRRNLEGGGADDKNVDRRRD